MSEHETDVYISAEDFLADPAKFLAKARRQKVVISGDGCSFNLFRIGRDDEKKMIDDYIATKVEPGYLPATPLEVAYDGMQLEDIMRGRAT